ncbi:MAG TPA: tetratricopeptide repeat protein, partial [Candidatus Hydrogenedentes bacterium]|nr:tetratricopeptide repeat protein [Candidatus Hydrogenedentota bacterium]
RLGDTEYGAALDVKMTFGLFCPAGTLVAELDGALYTVPKGHLRWSNTITVTPDPMLADTRLGNPRGGLLPDFGGNLVSIEGGAMSQWADDGGVRFRLAHEACVDAAVSALLCELGFVQEAAGMYQLGLQTLHKKNFDEAAAYFRKALELDPALLDAKNAWSVSEARAGRLEAAMDFARAILEIDPDYGPAHYNLGWWHAIDKRDIETARGHYERALALGMPISEKMEKALAGK